ncbi:MAG: RNA-directed DNA polymerase [Alphaproteobacteria bacterium]|nr:RNA-directed DNA polymerase [Alphaproteobacteria bacterium]
MRRFGGIYDEIFTVDRLYQGYLDARKTKRSRRGCFEFERHLGANLHRLHDELMAADYHPQPYYRFVIYEPKKRTIYAPAFRDCVVQHAIYRRVYPLFDATFIDTSFACRIGKGTHACADYVQAAMRRHDGDDYTLHLDVRKFFYSIDRAVLRALVAQKIKDKRLVDCMMMFAEYDDPVGVPIGNLLSQLYALIYLNPVDQFIKRDLKIRHYARYVDDMLLIGLTRAECDAARERITEFLSNRLHLSLSWTRTQKIKRGVNFVGYRTWRSKRFIRKHSLYKFRRAVGKSSLEGVVSALGHAARTQSLNHMVRYIQEKNHALYRQIPKSCRRRHHLSARRA